MTTKRQRVERDFPGHFIGAADCRFTRTTDLLPHYRVSTVGEYRPRLPKHVAKRLMPDGAPMDIGFGRTYETMVFPLGSESCPCGCGAPLIGSWQEIDMAGYLSEEEAIVGHELMVLKYLTHPMQTAPLEAEPSA